MIENATAAASAPLDERLKATPWHVKLLQRPELGAVAGTILVALFFLF